MLALTHISTRYPVERLRDEARTVFPATVVPRDFDEIVIPFAERGRPELVRWSEAGAGDGEEDVERPPGGGGLAPGAAGPSGVEGGPPAEGGAAGAGGA